MVNYGFRSKFKFQKKTTFDRMLGTQSLQKNMLQ